MNGTKEPIENVRVVGINEIEMEDGSKLMQCSCMTSQNIICVIYRPEKEDVKLHDSYDLYLSFNSKLKPIIKYVKVEKEK